MRPASLGDVRAIAAVHVRSWQVGYRGMLPDALLDALSVDERAERWHGYLTDPENGIETLVAVEGDAVLGFVSIAAASRDDDAGPSVAEIAALYVDPDHWRAGVARALMDAALEALRRGGAREVTLWVLEENARGRAFYDACGFAADGARDTVATGAPEIRLRRRYQAAS